MKKLLSLPPNLAAVFHEVRKVSHEEWYCTHDPIDAKLGSGGGTIWLLDSCRKSESNDTTLTEWLGREKRILLHAGGQSRRLPSYAPSGKILTPIPVFRWGRGQRLSQDLLSLQLPLYEEIMNIAPDHLHTLVASGDVFIHNTDQLQPIPADADVVCYGLWAQAELAQNHGVFFASRQEPSKLDFMLQKPSLDQLRGLQQSHFSLMDIGIWLLSDRAVALMEKRAKDASGNMKFYDMYSEFGLALGANPKIFDEELNSLKVAILPLNNGKFFHYGTSREMISSTLSIQNLETNQERIIHLNIKPHESIFVQNVDLKVPFTPTNENVWVENSYIGANWKITKNNIITGVPVNDWTMPLAEGTCVDVVPLGETSWVARPYGFNDKFKGDLADASTTFLGISAAQWLAERGLSAQEIEGNSDLQSSRIFPVVDDTDSLGKVLRWLTCEPQLTEGKEIWHKAQKLSADEISQKANLFRLVKQRDELRTANYQLLAKNYQRSVFYQIDLNEAAHDYVEKNIPLPKPLPETATRIVRISDAMFRSHVALLGNKAIQEPTPSAFELMSEGLIAEGHRNLQPRLSVYEDQIVWSRSPVRIDLAGGWTDTPPYSIMSGGNVVNIAINLNGQPPLQVYVKPSKKKTIILRSIDLGASEEVTTYEELSQFNKVGSPFSIPKAALALAGFHPNYSAERYASLSQQLEAFGSGLELTLLSAIPAGSGLGTSSILAATVLAGIGDFCGLGWDKDDVCHLTLILEQMLTTGGGWQDQYGGVLHGVKLLQTSAGWSQRPRVRWLPEQLFTGADYKACHLLYYTGITRTAKNILAEIVKGMFLNRCDELKLLSQMKDHALNLHDAIQLNDFDALGRMVRKTWQQNCLLDAGTNPPAVQAITSLIDDYCAGYKLPGAGGGGYIYMIAKDDAAAAKIKKILTENAPNSRARFVKMDLSQKGLEVSRS